MLQDYNYIAFDFETTGLDIQKDEPIQIGIVQFDGSGTVINTYASLIRPTRPIKELKGIVRFLTGFSLDDLQDAPDINTVIQEIQGFFTHNTVVVGHNIGFDCAILSKYLELPTLIQADTFPLSKALMHYLPSYALDIIHTHLVEKGLITASSNQGAHDALHDSFMSYDVFIYCIQTIQTLRRRYMMIDFVLQKSDGLIKSLIKRSEKQYKFDDKVLFLPPLQATSSTSKKVHQTDTISLPQEHFTTLGARSSSLQHLIKSINRSEKQRVISTTHRSKLQLVEHLLNTMYINHTTFGDQVVFDKDAINMFLHKSDFTNDEAVFIIKYYSHHTAGHKQMEINSGSEYTIFNALTHRKEKQRGNITLCTHQQLWYHAHKIDASDQVLFLDADWWHQSYNNAHKKPIDPYHLLNTIEQIAYKYTLLQDEAVAQHVSSLVDQYTIFLGVLYGELNQYFIGRTAPRRDFSYLLEDTRLPKTRASFPMIESLIYALHQRIKDDDQTKHLLMQFVSLKTYLCEQCTVEKKMYNGDKRRYLFHRGDSYVAYDEFIASLPDAQYCFVTTNKQKQTTLDITPKDHIPPSIALTTAPSIKQIIKHLTGVSPQSHFIFSTSKKHSKDLFQAMVQEKIHDTYTIVAENITGGVGKSVFHALQSEKPVIAIGGYNFYLELLAKKFAFGHVFLYHVYGSMKQQLVTDLVRYGT